VFATKKQLQNPEKIESSRAPNPNPTTEPPKTSDHVAGYEDDVIPDVLASYMFTDRKHTYSGIRVKMDKNTFDLANGSVRASIEKAKKINPEIAIYVRYEERGFAVVSINAHQDFSDFMIATLQGIGSILKIYAAQE
jgi:hypothetical protein